MTLPNFEMREMGFMRLNPNHIAFCAFSLKGAKLLLLNAFEKRQGKLPNREKTRALDTREEYKERIKKGTYYEED